MKQDAQNLAIFGAQWGDEGKGKIVDLLCEDYDVVARYQGGHNAGHTVKFADRHYSLHLIPSGVLHPGKLCVLGNGMVIDPVALLSEIEKLRSAGVTIGDNLRISDSAHLILPLHRELDLAREGAANDEKIGTTGRGIGPAYETKVSRYGIRVGELLEHDVLARKIRRAGTEINALLTGVYGRDAVDLEKVIEQYVAFGETMSDWLTDTTVLVNDAIRKGQRVMFEGAQGMLLDVDHGTYPFVTSSNTIVGGICTGLGVPPRAIDAVTAVVKAYTTRVGSGPFPTELTNAVGDRIRERGNEFGTTTGRPRRIGWLDLVVLRTAVMLNGIDSIALTKLDVLDDFEDIPVCVSYRGGAREYSHFPRNEVCRGAVQPVYETLKGWNTSTVGARTWEDLPPAARDYVDFIEGQLGVRVSIISTGPRREETIVRG